MKNRKHTKMESLILTYLRAEDRRLVTAFEYWGTRMKDKYVTSRDIDFARNARLEISAQIHMLRTHIDVIDEMCNGNVPTRKELKLT